MEHKNIISVLDDTTNQSSKFRTRNSVEINDESGGKYNVSNQIITSMIKSNLSDYSGSYIHVIRTIIAPNIGTVAASNNRDKKVIFKNCPPFTNCISKIYNKQVHGAHDIDLVICTYNLIEHSDPDSKYQEVYVSTIAMKQL